jgi:hypothetical protein
MEIRRRVLACAATIILLALIPARATAAEPPDQNIEGSFELVPSTGSWKDPVDLRGWAISRCGTPEIQLLIDGREVARAKPWEERPEIRERFPTVGSAEHPGFSTSIDPLRYEPGDHHVSVQVFSPECKASRSLGEHLFVSARRARPLQALSILVGSLALFVVIAWGLHRLPLRYHTIPLWWILPALLLLVMGAIVTTNGWKPGFQALANWDGGWYLSIAQEGYEGRSHAFFPLFPMLLRLFSLLPVPLPLAGSILNAGLFLASIRVLQKLYPERDSGLLVYAVLPFSFFFVSLYTESLALFLSVMFVWSLRERKPALAFVFGCLAGLTRITSIALLMFGIDEIRKKRTSTMIASTGPAVGIGLYSMFLWATTGDPLKFFHVQETFGRNTTFDLGRFIQMLTRSFRTPGGFDDVSIIVIAVVAVAAALLAFQGRIGEALYCAMLIAVPLSTLTLASLQRYALLAFPAFPLLAGFLRNRVVYAIVLLLEIYYLFELARHFGRGHWVG